MRRSGAAASGPSRPACDLDPGHTAARQDLTPLKNKRRYARQHRVDLNWRHPMTPYLALVLAGFALFVVVLGVVTTQGWIAALKAKSTPRQAARVEPPSPIRTRQEAH